MTLESDPSGSATPRSERTDGAALPSPLGVLTRPRAVFPALAEHPSWPAFFAVAALSGVGEAVRTLFRDAPALGEKAPPLGSVLKRALPLGALDGVLTFLALSLLLAWVTAKLERPLGAARARVILTWGSLPTALAALLWLALLAFDGGALFRIGSEALRGSEGGWPRARAIIVSSIDAGCDIWSIVLVVLGIAVLTELKPLRALARYFMAALAFMLLSVLATAAGAWRYPGIARNIAEQAPSELGSEERP